MIGPRVENYKLGTKSIKDFSSVLDKSISHHYHCYYYYDCHSTTNIMIDVRISYLVLYHQVDKPYALKQLTLVLLILLFWQTLVLLVFALVSDTCFKIGHCAGFEFISSSLKFVNQC
jgi:hypothetical protein